MAEKDIEEWMETADEEMAKQLPEAPASANLRVYIDGFSAQITIRGINHKVLVAEIEELVKLAKLKKWSPSWNLETNKELGYVSENGQPTTPVATAPTKACTTHPEAQMVQKYSKAKGKYYYVHFDAAKKPCFGWGFQI